MNRRLSSMRVWFSCLSFAWLLAACPASELPATQLVVRVQADGIVAARLSRVDVTIEAASGTSRRVEHSFSIAASGPTGKLVSFPFSFGVMRGQSDRIALRVAGFVAGSDIPLIEHRLLASFLARQTRLVEVALLSGCLERMCTSSDQTCYPASNGTVAAGSCGPIEEAKTARIEPGQEDLSTFDAGDLGVEAAAAPLDAGRDARVEQSEGFVTVPDAVLDARVEASAEAGVAPEAGPLEAAIVDEYALAVAGQTCVELGENSSACAGHAGRSPLRCRGGVWIAQAGCAEAERCDTRRGTTQGTCLPLAAACKELRAGPLCDGAARVECGLDLVSVRIAPCPAHGHCAPDAPASCVCDTGYVDDAPAVCRNPNDCPQGACAGGRCVDGLGDYTCDCPSGYAGTGTKACSVVDYCPEDACAPGGTCVDTAAWYCACRSGFSGSGTQACRNIDDCPIGVCTAPGGTCHDDVGRYTCECATGFSGVDCTNDVCNPSPCQNGGTCSRTAQGPSCACPVGFTGPSCQFDVCAPNPCKNGGTCARSSNGPLCTCANGYEGGACDTNKDDCPGNRCEHGSVCVDGVAKYSCDCSQTGYNGTFCGSDANECAGTTLCAGAISSGVSFSYTCTNLTPHYRCRGQFAEWPVNYAANRFSVTNGVAKDSATGLEWQAIRPSTYAGCASGRYCTQPEAKDYCARLTLAGGGFRLPTRAELMSLVELSRAGKVKIDDVVFPTPDELAWHQYWTASAYVPQAGHAWSLDFYTGSAQGYPMTQTMPVRCVR